MRYDEASQRRGRRSNEQYLNSRSARFDIEGININGTREQGAMDYNLLDSLMEQIPGKDNYPADITEPAFDESGDVLYSANPKTPNKPLNLGYYHRAFVQTSKDGKRSHRDQRTFSDRVFVAHTTSGRIAPQVYTNLNGQKVERRVTFAIPVEVIWLTPLHSWNPYNIPMKDSVTGKGTETDPYSGIGNKEYYMTPTEFFTGDFVQGDAADTVAGEVFVSTPQGTKKTRASGVRVFLPKIAGIESNIRQRYPIMPVHGEGSALWKKLNALEDAMEFAKAADIASGISYSTGLSHNPSTSGHQHLFNANEQDLADLRSGATQEISVTTESRNGHNHNLVIKRKAGATNGDPDEFFVSSCDTNSSAAGKVCWDNHSNDITRTEQ